MSEAEHSDGGFVPSVVRGDAHRRGAPSRTLGVLYALIVVTAGALSGWLWHAITTLPTYLTSDDGSVQITERALGRVFSADAIYVILGLLVGVGLGLAAWQFFRRLGWPVAVIALAGGLSAGTVCWLIGLMQGPRNFAARVAAAVPGEEVPVDFALHTPSAIFVWALGAIIPVMLYANLSREPGPPIPRSRPRKISEAGAQ